MFEIARIEKERRALPAAQRSDMNGPCTAPRVYDLCLNAPKREWFGFTDCAIRWALPLGTFYFYLIAYPLSFFRFCIAYNGVWHKDRPVTIALLSLFYPVMPFVHILLEVPSPAGTFRRSARRLTRGWV